MTLIFEQQPCSRSSRNFGIPMEALRAGSLGSNATGWEIARMRVHTNVHSRTHITWRIESATRARFDFIPLSASVGPSHKQSLSSRSRYEISFSGCWQVYKVFFPFGVLSFLTPAGQMEDLLNPLDVSHVSICKEPIDSVWRRKVTG